MRLLYRDNGELRLTTDSPPTEPYAILSHTWGEDKDELTLQDITERRYAGEFAKAGLKKVDFCINQAQIDGYRYVWVDTCCIDKRSQNELAEAINLMYKWYKDAAVCYVYLADLAKLPDDKTDVKPDATAGAVDEKQIVKHVQKKVIKTGVERVEESRWFTRGWTLQELIAPSKLKFYTSNGQYIGNRTQLRDQIKAASGIDCSVQLRDVPLVERFKWSLTRETKKDEDMSYCMLGLLEVKMLFSYGEGADRARERLFKEVEEEHGRKGREVREAFLAWNAARLDDDVALLTPQQLLDSLSFENMGARKATIAEPLPSTCVWLSAHQDFRDWSDMKGRRFFWIKGKPGAGKSTLVKYADSQKDSCMHISFFFHARGAALERTVAGMYRTLLFQLLRRLPDTQQLIIDYLQDLGTKWSWSRSTLQEALRILVNQLDRPVRCFVDALDECAVDEIQDMVDFFQDLTTPLLFVRFASRHYPTVTIQRSVQIYLEDQRHGDLERYVNERLDLQGVEGQKLKDKVVRKANGIFLSAVLLVRELNKQINEGSMFNIEAKLDALPARLRDLLEDIIMRVSQDDARFRRCLDWILFAKRPMTSEEFYYAMAYGELKDDRAYMQFRVSEAVTVEHMERCVLSYSRGLAELTRSSQTVTSPTDDTSPETRVRRVQFIHESIREFLLDQQTLQRLHPDVTETVDSWIHDRLKHVCFKYVSKMLSHEVPWRRIWLQHNEDTDLEDDKQPFPDHPFLLFASQGIIYHADQAAKDIDQDDLFHALAIHKWREFFVMEIVAITDYGSTFEETYSPVHTFAVHDAARLIETAHRLGHGLDGLQSLDSPLILAVTYRKSAAARALITCGARLDVQRSDGSTSLSILARPDTADPELLELLLDTSDAIGSALKDGNSALQEAVLHGQLSVVKVLLRHGADLVAGKSRDCGVLVTACAQRDIRLVKLLIDYGADVNQLKDDGSTALMIACENSDLEIVNLLLRMGATTSNQDQLGHTALIKACQSSAAVTTIAILVEVLLAVDRGESVNVMSGTTTALSLACMNGHDGVVALLLEKGADVRLLPSHFMHPFGGLRQSTRKLLAAAERSSSR